MVKYLIIISNLKPKENHEKSSLTLSLSFWLHAEKNGFYLGSDILGGSYVQATIPNIVSIINNLYPQSYPSSPSPSNSNNSSTVSYPGGSGGLFNELSFGYKYFLGKKRIIGFRHSLFFGYQLGGVGSVPGSGLIVFLPYGFNTDLLINWTNDKRASQKYVERRVKGLSIFYKDMTGRTLDANTLKKYQSTYLENLQGL